MPTKTLAGHAKASEFMYRPGIAALYAGLIGVASWRAETGINSRPLTANVRPLMGSTGQT